MSHTHRATLGAGQGATAWDLCEAFRSTRLDATRDDKEARARAHRALTGPHTDATIEDMMVRAGLVLRHAASPAELDLPVTVRGDSLLLDAETDAHGYVSGHTVLPNDPLFYLTDNAGTVLAILQYYWHEDVPPPARCASVNLLYVFHRRHGLGTILAALAMREAARDGPFTVGAFIDDVVSRNIHYGLFEESRPPIAEDDFDESDGIDGNHVRNGQKAETIARKYLESLLGV